MGTGMREAAQWKAQRNPGSKCREGRDCQASPHYQKATGRQEIKEYLLGRWDWPPRIFIVTWDKGSSCWVPMQSSCPRKAGHWDSLRSEGHDSRRQHACLELMEPEEQNLSDKRQRMESSKSGDGKQRKQNKGQGRNLRITRVSYSPMWVRAEENCPLHLGLKGSLHWRLLVLEGTAHLGLESVSAVGWILSFQIP